MARKKIYYKYEIPSTVVNIVKEICADYTRRKKAIRDNIVEEKTLLRYIELNHAVDKAMLDVEQECRESFIYDIAVRRGYESSQAQMCMCREAYYNRKRKAVYDIAYQLDLVDNYHEAADAD